MKCEPAPPPVSGADSADRLTPSAHQTRETRRGQRVAAKSGAASIAAGLLPCARPGANWSMDTVTNRGFAARA